MSQDVGKLRCWIAQVPLYISKYFIINFTFSSITTLTVYIHPQLEINISLKPKVPLNY